MTACTAMLDERIVCQASSARAGGVALELVGKIVAIATVIAEST